MDAMKWWKEKLDKALQPRPRKKREPSPYATFNERLMATAIDMTLLFMLLNRPARVMSDKIYSHLSPEEVAMMVQARTFGEQVHSAFATNFMALYLINFGLQFLFIGVCVVICQAWIQTTPGKWLLGIKLTTADYQTFPATWRLVVRYLAYAISCVPLMLGFVMMNVDPQKRTLHDRIAGTRVLTTRPEGWYWAQFKRIFAKFKDSNG